MTFRLAMGDFDTWLRIERPVPNTAADGAGSGAWALVGEAWAQLWDMPPSRTDRLADGMSIATRPARVRMHFRDDVTSDMRFVAGDRVMQIVGGPATLGRYAAVEFMVEDYTPAGNPS